MKILSSTVFFTFFLSLLCFAQEKINFKISPKQGGLLKYEMKTQTDIEGEQSILMDMRVEMIFNPIKVTDTTINFEVTYANLKMDMSTGMMMMSYDSNKEPQDDFSKSLAASLDPLLNNTLAIVMNRKGKIKSVDFPNVPDQAFDRSTIQNISTSFPDNAISIGESWTDTKSMNQLGLTMKIKNTLEDKTKEGYKVSTTGIIINNNSEEIGTISGHSWIDSKTYFTKSTVANSTMEFLGNKMTISTKMKQLD